MQTPKPTKAAKAEARRAMLRRFAMRRQRAETEALAKVEQSAGDRQARRLARSECTGNLAARRIKACAEFPSPFAVRQLVSIAGNIEVPALERVEASARLLRLSDGLSNSRLKGS